MGGRQILTEFRYHLNFIQNHSFSLIPASFSVGFIDLRWRWSVRTFSSGVGLGGFSPQIGLLLEDVQAVLPDWAFFFRSIELLLITHRLAILLKRHTHTGQGNTFDVSDSSVQLISHFCIFRNALRVSFSCHFIYFQPFTVLFLKWCACLHCLLH